MCSLFARMYFSFLPFPSFLSSFSSTSYSSLVALSSGLAKGPLLCKQGLPVEPDSISRVGSRILSKAGGTPGLTGIHRAFCLAQNQLLHSLPTHTQSHRPWNPCPMPMGDRVSGPGAAGLSCCGDMRFASNRKPSQHPPQTPSNLPTDTTGPSPDRPRLCPV